MGVHDLWSIVEPVRESVSLYSLSGKTLAVDLSLWVCEAQHVQAMMGRVVKPHLRNLFFRVSSLTLMGIKLLFVMEGEAPKLKSETMRKRNEARQDGFKKKPAFKSSTNTNRGRFNAVLKECAEMLDCLGVPWVKAAGEAEAMCAYLDSQGLVDGCITNDGDAFLYGAQTVYRNFNMSSKDPQVDCYQTSRVQTQLHLSRENLVGLAILLGCDYIPKGIPGVGKEQALRLIQSLNGGSFLQRIKQWKEEENPIASNVAVKKVPHCNLCRHPGSAKAHERGGCTFCGSQRYCQPQDFDYCCPCDWHRQEKTRQAASAEATIRRKTLESPDFPFTEIIKEFLVSKDKPVSNFRRRQPNMLLIQKFAHEKMEWPKHYTSEKVLVLITYSELMNRKHGRDVSSQIRPVRIVKPRVRNAVACLEVVWTTPDHYVFPEDLPAEAREVRTVEEESLFRVAFPEIVDDFTRSKALAQESKTKKKRQKNTKEKPTTSSDNLSELLAKMDLQSSSTRHQAAQSNSSSSDPPEVIVLDSPAGKEKLRQEKEEEQSAPATPPCCSASEEVASPSVSAVVEALHLSDIDWDALSFTSSPTTQASRTGTPREETTGGDERRGQETSGEVKQRDMRCAAAAAAAGVCYTDYSLRDRLLMRSTSVTDEGGSVSKCSSVEQPESKSEVDLVESISSYGKIRVLNPERVLGLKENKAWMNGGQCEVKTPTAGGQSFKKHRDVASHVWGNSHPPQKLPPKYKFTRAAFASSPALPLRCHSHPGRDHGNPPNTAGPGKKKSVCTDPCSSDEDSDAENDPFPPRGAASRRKAEAKKKHFLLKPSDQPGAVRSQETEDVFLQSPASPVTVLDDDDDDVICCDSPLPLTERLRLKFSTLDVKWH